MTGAANSIDRLYHQPLWGRTDPALRRSLAGSAALGALTLVLILLAPSVPPTPMTFEQVPDRIARLILEKPKPAAPPRTETARLEEVKPAEAPKPAAKKPEPVVESAPPKTEVATARPVQPPQRRAEPPRVAADQGVKGREQAAADVTANLKQVTGSLDKALGDLAQSLPKAGQSSPVTARGPGRRARSVREARSGDQLGGVGSRTQLAAVDLEALGHLGIGRQHRGADRCGFGRRRAGRHRRWRRQRRCGRGRRRLRRAQQRLAAGRGAPLCGRHPVLLRERTEAQPGSARQAGVQPDRRCGRARHRCPRRGQWPGRARGLGLRPGPDPRMEVPRGRLGRHHVPRAVRVHATAIEHLRAAETAPRKGRAGTDTGPAFRRSGPCTKSGAVV